MADLPPFPVPPLNIDWMNGGLVDPRSPRGAGGMGRFTTPGPLGAGDLTMDLLGLNPLAPCARFGDVMLGRDAASLQPKKAVVTTLEWATLREDFVRWEGKVSHMYLDTKSLVTVGIGKLLSTVADAQALGFVKRADKKAATAAEIKADYDKVAKQTGGMIASKYKQYTLLDLPDDVIFDLLKVVADGFIANLKDNFDGWDDYPASAKRALIDMIYNLGLSGLLKFKQLKKSVEAKDWKKAATQCHRTGPSDERNDWTRDMFLEAAN